MIRHFRKPARKSLFFQLRDSGIQIDSSRILQHNEAVTPLKE